jgi:hypothetical protein
LFSAGIEPNPGPDGVNLSATGEESKATSTGEGGSVCSASTAPSNIVQRKRSRATVAMNQQERAARRTTANEERARHQAAVTERRVIQRLGDEAVETKRKDVSNFFSGKS